MKYATSELAPQVGEDIKYRRKHYRQAADHNGVQDIHHQRALQHLNAGKSIPDAAKGDTRTQLPSHTTARAAGSMSFAETALTLARFLREDSAVAHGLLNLCQTGPLLETANDQLAQLWKCAT